LTEFICCGKSGLYFITLDSARNDYIFDLTDHRWQGKSITRLGFVRRDMYLIAFEGQVELVLYDRYKDTEQLIVNPFEKYSTIY